MISLSRTKINDIYELLSAPETKLFLNSNKYEHDQAQRFFKSYLNGTYEEKLQKHTEQSFGYTQRTNEELRCEFLNKQMDLFYIMMQEKRQKLPAFQMKRLILEKIEYNQVLLISGETGCGKTTQVCCNYNGSFHAKSPRCIEPSRILIKPAVIRVVLCFTKE